MALFFLLHLLLIIMVSFAMFGEGANDCKESRCNSDGPSIRFPFRLQHQPQHCGYPGFELSCTNNKTILSTLPNSLILIVEDIDYASQEIRLYYPRSCIVNLLHFNFSASPFLLKHEPFLCNFSIFSPSGISNGDFGSQNCSATSDSGLIALSDSENLEDYPTLLDYKKIEEISSVPCDLGYDQPFWMSWLNPKCGNCGGLGMDCGFKNYSNQLQGTQCFDKPTTKGGFKEPLIAGGVLGFLLLGIILLALYEFYSSSKIERENQARVEKFLEDYRALRPTRYTYAEIIKITNMFHERLGEGAYGVVYKGTLSNEIHVAVKVLNDSIRNGEEFINEVAAMGKIHHFNVLRLVGYCTDGFRNARV